MATYKGVDGVRSLVDDIHDKLRNVVAKSGSAVANELINTTDQLGVIGIEEYPSRQGAIPNEAGDYINNWHVGVSVKNQINPPDPLGSDARIEAADFHREYELGKPVYIYNSIDYAHNVEDGWPADASLGWKEKRGYGVVDAVADVADNLLLQTAISVANGQLDDDEVPF